MKIIQYELLWNAETYYYYKTRFPYCLIDFDLDDLPIFDDGDNMKEFRDGHIYHNVQHKLAR